MRLQLKSFTTLGFLSLSLGFKGDNNSAIITRCWKTRCLLTSWSLAFPVVKLGLILLRYIIILESNCENIAEKRSSRGVSLRLSGIFHELEQLIYILYLCVCVCIYTC